MLVRIMAMAVLRVVLKVFAVMLGLIVRATARNSASLAEGGSRALLAEADACSSIAATAFRSNLPFPVSGSASHYAWHLSMG